MQQIKIIQNSILYYFIDWKNNVVVMLISTHNYDLKKCFESK